MSLNIDNEITGTTLDIIEGLNKIEYGEHIILIYPNLYALREIYSHYCNIALKNDELVLILTYYETAGRIRQTLKELNINVEKYEKENDLVIIEDSIEINSGYKEDFLSLLKTLDKQQKKRSKNGISVIADMGVFFHSQNNKDALVDFESSLPSKFDMNVKRICNYHSGDFDRFEKYEKDNLIEPHHRRIKVLPELASEDKSATSIVS
jgi:MEDS: MEthanogen/methylotroph, DcmR Sensory domain